MLIYLVDNTIDGKGASPRELRAVLSRMSEGVEVLTEPYLLPGFIAEDKIERQLLIEFLFDPNVTQGSRQTRRRISRLRPRAVKR